MDIDKFFLMDNFMIIFLLVFNKKDILHLDTTKDILHMDTTKDIPHVVDKFKDTDLNHEHIMVVHQHDFL